MTSQTISYAFPILFPLLWITISLVLGAFSGWRRLAEKYGAVARIEGPRLSMQSGSIGGVQYNGVLTLTLTPQGLGLSVLFLFRAGHPPVLVPWADVRVESAKRLFETVGRFHLGGEADVVMELPIARARRLEALASGRFRLPPPAAAH